MVRSSRRQLPSSLWPRGLGALAAAMLSLQGCVTLPRRPVPPGEYAQALPRNFSPAIRWFGETRHGFTVRSATLLQRVKQTAGAHPVTVLVLSGGGAGGAFGAGALVGWSRRGTRPQFDIVTGVSAGALIAPLAFLGPQWDPQLADAFSGAHTSRLSHMHWLLALFGRSALRAAPLRELVSHYITPRLVQALATEARRGRLLLVATTDLDSEEPVFWNLGLIAEHGGPSARKLICEVLVASASVPGVFPPVIIPVQVDGRRADEMHVDGSVATPLFFIPDVAAILPQPLTPLQGGQLFVLVNGPFGTPYRPTRDRTFPILKRSIEGSLTGDERAAVELAYLFAERQDINMQVAVVPDAYPYGGSLDFDRPTMHALFDFGVRCGESDALWVNPLDALDPSVAHTANSTTHSPCSGVAFH